MSTDPADLEFTADEMRRMGHATVERLVDHVLSLATQPARGDVAAADLCRRLREPAPERGVAYEPLLDRLLTEWVPRSFTSSGPGYLAYIPGGGLYPIGANLFGQHDPPAGSSRSTPRVAAVGDVAAPPTHRRSFASH